MVWTIPSPSPVLWELGAARLVSTPSRRKFPSGLGSGSPFQVSPNLGSSASPVSRRALKFSSSPLRMPFRHARVAAMPYDSAASGNLHLRFQFALWSVGSLGGFVLLFRFGPHDVDRGGVKMNLDVRPIVFLDPLDASAGSFSQSGRCRRRPSRQAWIAAGIGVGLFLSVAIWLGSLP